MFFGASPPPFGSRVHWANAFILSCYCLVFCFCFGWNAFLIKKHHPSFVAGDSICIFGAEWIHWSGWGLIAFDCTQQEGGFIHFASLISAGNTTASHNLSFLDFFFTPPESTVDLTIQSCVCFGSWSIPCWANRCFQGHRLLGNKSAEIPNLNGVLPSITGRWNCNRKAIIIYSSVERHFAQWFPAIAAN